ncbi:glycoside hydrolase family 13 protein [Tautonia sociabilis]|uniref:Glycoside hydrolase family 13 protein n=1 Tax=Tautonia sociabilis TaxID=2080755 RepID=A0A432MMY7_9BACT|nr:glycoside hydrolase family 13 protein [Tautonia sociabilis]RUL88476.1 glycoside hydrolase family 13 protein [Tautonia sociabilis]
MSEPQTPDWVRDAVFYQIFPDRFARSDRVPKAAGLQPWGATPTIHGYQGGDLLGVSERLDYLEDLGVNAIYFTPVFQSASNHRYHTHDYSKVDPMLGGNAALRELLDRAHERGIRVVLDGVFNHCSRGFFPFHDLLENGQESAYIDWFHVEDFPLTAYHPDQPANYACWWGLHALPKFRIETPAVREFLWGVARSWIDFGIDGWRLDVPQEIDDDSFWREFRRRVKQGNPDAYIVGEIWGDGSRWLKGDMFDAVMNYIFTRACITFFIGKSLQRRHLEPEPLRDAQPADAREFAAQIDRMRGLYHPNVNAVLMNLLGSHDTARFRTLAGGDTSAVRLASLFQMTFPGAPCIYYGDEIGMEGGHEPASRGAFPWDESRWDLSLRDDIRRFTRLRHDEPALRRGSFETIFAEGSVFGFLRRLGDDAIVVLLNAGQDERIVTVALPKEIADGTMFADRLESGAIRLESGALRSVRVGPRSGRVLAAEARR